MTHDDASVETGVGGQAKYDVMMVLCGNALQKHHKTLKTSTRRYSDCHILQPSNLLQERPQFSVTVPGEFVEQILNIHEWLKSPWALENDSKDV